MSVDKALCFQNQLALKLNEKSISQKQQAAVFYVHIVEKLEQVLSSLQQELTEMQNKHHEQINKLVKQIEQKDKLILSLTKINNGLMKDNARIKKKSDSQFQYFVKRIAQTECSALNQKKQLEEVVSEWEKTLSRISSKKNKQHQYANTDKKWRNSLNPQLNSQKSIDNQFASTGVPLFENEQERQNKQTLAFHNRIQKAPKRQPPSNQRYSVMGLQTAPHDRMLASSPVQMQSVN